MGLVSDGYRENHSKEQSRERRYGYGRRAALKIKAKIYKQNQLKSATFAHAHLLASPNENANVQMPTVKRIPDIPRVTSGNVMIHG